MKSLILAALLASTALAEGCAPVVGNPYSYGYGYRPYAYSYPSTVQMHQSQLAIQADHVPQARQVEAVAPPPPVAAQPRQPFVRPQPMPGNYTYQYQYYPGVPRSRIKDCYSSSSVGMAAVNCNF